MSGRAVFDRVERVLPFGDGGMESREKAAHAKRMKKEGNHDGKGQL